MISLKDFKEIISRTIGINIEDNQAQNQSISYNGDKILKIVAGPGSGKTLVLVLRALKHLFVEGHLPETILITTFTRKAAKELRTRWLELGSEFITELKKVQIDVDHIDLNRCKIDTLDSICHQTISENKLPGTVAPVVVEKPVADLIFKRMAFSKIYHSNQPILDSFLAKYSFDGKPPSTQGEALKICKVLCDRLIQEIVNLDIYEQASEAHLKVAQILRMYLNYLSDNSIFDFSTLESRFFSLLKDEQLKNWVNEIGVLLIDEYQDTNLLQESIYFQLIKASNSLKTTIVGDDDQAMYRFRGGVVELFTNFDSRCEQATGKDTHRVDMIRNYRSTEEIINYYNSHIVADASFSSARISPPKPSVVSNKGKSNIPVIGMFSDNEEDLAENVASWIQKIFSDRYWEVSTPDGVERIDLHDDCNFGDLVYLGHSVDEASFDKYNSSEKSKFPAYLRNSLKARSIKVFNPRGYALRQIPDVQILLGLTLKCLDPSGSRTDAIMPTKEAAYYFRRWRNVATDFIDSNPTPTDSGGIEKFVKDWGKISNGESETIPETWPILEIFFKLLTWLPRFQKNAEHQVWLEAVLRTISSSGIGSPYGMNVFKDGNHSDRSRESFIRDALIPIASDEVGVDEEIIPSVPRDHISMMTIHQAKGLEFPIAIVNVGTQFKTNHHTQRFLRYPDNPSNVTIMEDSLDKFTLTSFRNERSKLDRTFDDLIRLYYVAYSRPESILLLVGNEKCLGYGKGAEHLKSIIPHIALGWQRDKRTWNWRQKYDGRKPPVKVEPPFLELY